MYEYVMNSLGLRAPLCDLSTVDKAIREYYKSRSGNIPRCYSHVSFIPRIQDLSRRSGEYDFHMIRFLMYYYLGYDIPFTYLDQSYREYLNKGDIKQILIEEDQRLGSVRDKSYLEFSTSRY